MSLRIAIAVVVLIGCGPASQTLPDGGLLDGGPGAGILCNDGFIFPICRCTSVHNAECTGYCSRAASDGAAECTAQHGGLDGGYRANSCAEAPSCG